MNISIIDDHKLVSQLLKLSLSQFDFIESINIFNDAEQFFEHADFWQTNLLITDMLMPKMNGVDVINKCRGLQTKAELKILVLSTVADAVIINDAFAIGANGYLGKDVSIKELIKAIKFVDAEINRSYVGEGLKNVLPECPIYDSFKFNLSPREKELLNNVCVGKTAKEISTDLALSLNTVQSYMKQLMRKMEVKRTPDLILKAIKYGMHHPQYLA